MRFSRYDFFLEGCIIYNGLRNSLEVGCYRMRRIFLRSARNQAGLANWVKWLIGVISVCLLIILVSGAIIGAAIYKGMQGIVDPEEAEKTFNKIVDSKPLSKERYKFSGGLDLAGKVMISTIEDKEDHYQFVLTRIEDNDKQLFKGRTLSGENIQEAFGSRMRQGSGKLDSSEFRDGGTMTVGDQLVNFNISTGMIDGKKIEQQLIGAVCPKDGVVTIIQSVSYSYEETFDMKASKIFLSHIKGFK